MDAGYPADSEKNAISTKKRLQGRRESSTPGAPTLVLFEKHTD